MSGDKQLLTGNVLNNATIRGITNDTFTSTFTNTNLTFTAPTATYYSAASL